MIDVTKEVERLDNAIKDNNDWFYDRPSSKGALENMSNFCQAYFKIVPKWITLNDAAIEARSVIAQLRQTVFTQDKEIKRLHSILSDNDIVFEQLNLEESK